MQRALFLISALLLANFYVLLAAAGGSSAAIARFRRDSKNKKQPNDPRARNIIWACYVVTTRLPWADKCLTRSLTCITLLRALGYRAELHVGARHGEDDSVEAHTWVSDTNGQVLCDNVNDLESYQELN